MKKEARGKAERLFEKIKAGGKNANVMKNLSLQMQKAQLKKP